MSNILKIAGAGVSSEETDENFNQTVLLLHGDGSNGAQNNAFLDSSTNNFTITRAGNTTQGTFSPFSAPDGRWSNYFDASGDSLTAPYSSTLALGTGDCTIEAWVYLASYPQQFSNIVDVRESGGYSNDAISFSVENDGTLSFYAGSYSGVTHVLETASGKVTLNAWHHVALTRASGTTKLYVNGVEEASSANSWNQTSGTATTLYIGNASLTRQVNGYISNLRIIKGTAVAPPSGGPASPVTSVSGTQLLTCQSNRFVDNSTNAFAITRNGDVKVTPFSPFAPTAAYDPAVNGGSMYADGSAASLTWSGTTLTGDFTVECWVYSTAVDGSGYTNILSKDATGNEQFAIDNTNVGSISLVIGASIVIPASGTAVTKNAWHHLAWVCERSTNTFRAYVDGVQQGSGTSTRTTTVDKIAQFRGGGFELNGYMSDFRIVNGTCLYPGGTTFTPPTGPLTNITNTSLLLNFTNAGIFDNTGKNNLETVGNAQIDTTTKQFGTGSMEFDGSGDYLSVPASSSFDIGTGEFTVEGWIYPNNVSGIKVIVECFTASSGPGWTLYLNSNLLVCYLGSGGTVTFSSSSNVSATTWTHFALVRSSSTITMYLNGASVGSASNSSFANSTGPLYVGGRTTTYPFNGFIDDLRITKGVARYTTTFTPPTKAFPDQ